MDTLTVVFSTTRDGADAGAVQSQLKQALDAALQQARKIARPGQVEVRTGPFSMQPRYGNKGSINGWQGNAQLVVQGTDIGAISQLVGQIQTLSVQGVNQGLARATREKAESEATAAAIAAFRQQADSIVRQFGFTRWQIRDVQVNTNQARPYAPKAMMMSARAAVVDESPLPTEGGQAEVTASVSGSIQMLP